MELNTQELICFSYTCSSQSEELIKRVKYSNKILLPPTILYKLNSNNDTFDHTLFFKIINKVIVNIVYKINILNDCFKVFALLKIIKLFKDFLNLL